MEQLLKFIEINQYALPAFIGLIGIYICLMWIAVAVWVWRDITTRIQNLLITLLVTTAVLIGNVPALILYLLARPVSTLAEKENQRLLYASIVDENIVACAHCQSLIRKGYKHCPVCGLSTSIDCGKCHKSVNSTWKHCIYCGYDLHPNTTYFAQLKLKAKQTRVYIFNNTPTLRRFFKTTSRYIFNFPLNTVKFFESLGNKVLDQIKKFRIQRKPKVEKRKDKKVKSKSKASAKKKKQSKITS